MKATPLIRYVGLPGSDIEIIPGTSQEFSEILNSFAGAGSVSILQSIVPYSVIVKNRAAPQVLAVVVRIDGIKNPQGEQISHQMILRQTLSPGEMVLSTPIGGLSIPLRKGILASPALQNTSQLSAELARRSQEYQAQPEVNINLDLVVFAYGNVVGPDKGNNIRRLNLETDANVAMASSVMKLAAVDRVAYLQSILDTPEKPARTLEDEDAFSNQQKRAAELMQLYLGAMQSEDELQAALNDYIQSQLPRLYRRSK